jgi:hypothetical protein
MEQKYSHVLQEWESEELIRVILKGRESRHLIYAIPKMGKKCPWA